MTSLNEFGVPRGRMGIESYKSVDDRDWHFLTKVLPRNITPSDIDGIVEASGNFWVMEYKKEGKPVPLGQKILLERLVKKGFCVTIIWHRGLCTNNDIARITFLIPHREPLTRDYVDSTSGLEALSNFAKWWVENYDK